MTILTGEGEITQQNNKNLGELILTTLRENYAVNPIFVVPNNDL